VEEEKGARDSFLSLFAGTPFPAGFTESNLPLEVLEQYSCP
jgi:hypothetical protein